ncbi:MAG: pantoate--beta-alanine ligase [Candidatus Nitrospinota bacterium M3_3B_026]
MIIQTKPAAMNIDARRERILGNSIGLVPTLGCLHEGHEALIQRAKKENDIVVVSIFVNPPQFRAKAYREYPRDIERDISILRKRRVDYLFSPRAQNMYPENFDTVVEVKALVDRLEGASIRWSYRAVTTVVAKLFNIVQPDRAYLGMKDPHQLAIIRRMTEDLNFPVKIVAVPTRRARDGLALSSRNSQLSKEERKAALVIPNSLKEIERRIRKGEGDRKKLSEDLAAMIESEPLANVEHAAVVDADTLREDVRGGKTLIYAAARVGGKRLTDNRVVAEKKAQDGKRPRKSR